MSGPVAGALGGATQAGKAPGEIKTGLYSITYLGLWYRGDALTMEQVVQRAKQYGYEGVEIDGKRPHGCPLDWPAKRCREFRQYASDQGIAICGVAANNDFSSPIPEHRASQLAYVRDLIRMTSDLEAKVLRVFLAWPGANKIAGGGGRYDLARRIWELTHEGIPETEAWGWCREALAESARYAGEYGAALALQNHRPIITNYRQVLQMVREVGSPHLKVCLDAPIMERKDPEYLRQAVLDVGPLQVQSHFGGEYERKGPGEPIVRPVVRSTASGQYEHAGYEDMSKDFYPPFIRALLEIGYRGWINYELCHPLPVVDGRTVGLDFVDNCARLAAEYMRGVIAEAKKARLSTS